MMVFIYYLCAFVIAIGLLVTVHEWGHFYVARLCGVHVLRFSIGFGRSLCQWTDRKGTTYALAILPLGGYVKMLNENEGPVPVEQKPHAFNNQSLWRRSAIVVAGPLANFIFAILVFAGIYTVGIKVIPPVIGDVLPHSYAADVGLRASDEILRINHDDIVNWEDVLQHLIINAGTSSPVALEMKSGRHLNLNLQAYPFNPDADYLETLGIQTQLESMPAVVGTVIPDSPAARAGVKAEDMILAINHQPIKGWLDLVDYVHLQPFKTTVYTIRRAGQSLNISITPTIKTTLSGEQVGMIGVMAKDVTRIQRYSPIAALLRSVHHTYTMSITSLQMIARMLVGKADLRNLSGPISIAKGAGQSAQGGLEYYLAFLGLISVSLAVINLLPIPLLDGGHLLYYAIEWIRGRPVSEEVQQIGMTIGIVLLMCIMSIALYNDFTGL